MHVSVIVTTYEKPRELELTLRAYACQDDPDFQVVVADDGSGPATDDVVRRIASDTDLSLVHVWHEDRGFRKTEILNRAVTQADGEYLIFTDGDCLPRRDFVRTHRELAEEGRFLSGGYVRLGPGLTESLTVDDVENQRVFRSAWLRRRGQTLGRRRMRLLPRGVLPRLLDLLTPTRATWNGMNASASRDAVLAVNGFDMELAYGGLDRELGQRLENLGLRGKQVRHRAVLVHLHHERPYRDADTVEAQRRRRERVRREGITRTPDGISELSQSVGTRVRRHGTAGAAEGTRRDPSNATRTGERAR